MIEWFLMFQVSTFPGVAMVPIFIVARVVAGVNWKIHERGRNLKGQLIEKSSVEVLLELCIDLFEVRFDRF